MSNATPATELSLLHELLVLDQFSSLLGFQLVSATVDSVVIELPITNSHTNGHAVCHGGVLFSLGDTALAFAAGARRLMGVTAAADIRFFATVTIGDRVRATTRVEHTGNRLATFAVDLHNQLGVLVAVFRGTAYGKRMEGEDTTAKVEG